MKEYDIIIKVYNCIDEVEEEPFRQIVYAENLESAKKMAEELIKELQDIFGNYFIVSLIGIE